MRHILCAMAAVAAHQQLLSVRKVLHRALPFVRFSHIDDGLKVSQDGADVGWRCDDKKTGHYFACVEPFNGIAGHRLAIVRQNNPTVIGCVLQNLTILGFCKTDFSHADDIEVRPPALELAPDRVVKVLVGEKPKHCTRPYRDLRC
jgi:hypothetical protein